MKMASLDPVLDLLPRAPLAGLDVNAVQRERKNYWERLYEKVLSEQDQSGLMFRFSTSRAVSWTRRRFPWTSLTTLPL